MAGSRNLDRAWDDIVTYREGHDFDGAVRGNNGKGMTFSRAVARNRKTWALAPEGSNTMKSRELVVRELIVRSLTLFKSMWVLLTIILFTSATLSAQTPAF